MVLRRAGIGVLVLSCLAMGQPQQRRLSQEEMALVDVEDRWVAALVKGDVPTLDMLFVETYVDTDEEGHRSDKSELLDVVRSGELRFESIKLSDERVYLYGNFAVVTGTGEQVGMFQGKALKTKVVFTDSFVFQNGRWRAVASQRTAPG